MSIYSCTVSSAGFASLCIIAGIFTASIYWIFAPVFTALVVYGAWKMGEV